MDALNHAIVDMTDLMLIKKALWDDYMNRLHQDEEPIEVRVTIDGAGNVFANAPDHITVKHMDYREGDDCDQCGEYVRRSDMRHIRVTKGSKSGQGKQAKMCIDCLTELVRWP
jgi:hypothetical protein